MIEVLDVIQNALFFIALYYIVFWIVVLLETEDNGRRKGKFEPEVSIIIPAWNEEDSIVDSLVSLTKLDYPKEKLSLLFVNDGSTDRTLERARKYFNYAKRKFNYRSLKIIDKPNGGKHTALNKALEYVSTKYFVTLDADSFPENDSLKNLMNEFSDSSVAAVSSVMKVYKPENLLQNIQWFEYSVNHYYKNLISRIGLIHVLPGPFSAYRTDIVKKIGCFRPAYMTEDMELAMRLQQHDHKIIQCGNSVVYTKSPENMSQLYNQRHRWNYGTLKNLMDYKKMFFNKRYGDFGYFHLPMILLSGILSIAFFSLLLLDIWKAMIPFLKTLYLYNFNIFEYMHSLTFNFILLDMDLRAIVTFVTIFAITITIIWLSLKFYREKYKWGKSLPFGIYVLFYFIFLAVVWIVVFKDALFGKKSRWR